MRRRPASSPGRLSLAPRLPGRLALLGLALIATQAGAWSVPRSCSSTHPLRALRARAGFPLLVATRSSSDEGGTASWSEGAADDAARQRIDELQSRLEVQQQQIDELGLQQRVLLAGQERLAEENSLLQRRADEAVEKILSGERFAELARQNFLKNLGNINLFVILTFGLGIAYSLLAPDLSAIFALYYFDLGPDLYPGFSKGVIALDLILKLPGTLLHQYEALVPTNPVFYKACTSGVAYTFGDFISQLYQGRDLDTLDLSRSARSGAAGFIGHGPLCHYWMLAMENYLDFDGAWWGTGIKVLADQTVWSLYLNAMYSGLIGLLAFRNPKDVWADVQATSWPALRSSWRFWPFVHCISFSHAVPLDLKLLWVDVMEIVWVTILSKVANQDESAEGEPQAVVSDTLGVDPSLEIELSRQMMAGGELSYASATGWSDCTEDSEDCYVWTGGGEETKPSTLVLPSAEELLQNLWPLAAFWPILFAFHSASVALGFE